MKRFPLKKSLIWKWLLGIGLGSLFLLLAIISQSVDLNSHNRYLNQIRQINELDTRLNQNMLAARSGLLNHYDPITNDLNDLSVLRNQLSQPPAFIDSNYRQQIQKLVQSFERDLKQKSDLTEQFLADNAVLRNSLSYLPIIITNVTNSASKIAGSAEVVDRLNLLLKNILIYNTSPSIDLVPVIRRDIDSLSRDRQNLTAFITKKDAWIIINHSQIILRRQEEVSRLLKAILAVPLVERGNEIFAAYNQGYQSAINVRNVYRFLLFLFLLLLVTAIGLLIIHQLRRSAAIIQIAEAKYRSIFENSADGIFQTTADGRYLSANPALARICGYASPEALISSISDISRQLYVQPDRRAEFIRQIQEKGAVINFESQVYRQDGNMIWVSENARAVYDRQGTMQFYEGTVTDITARREAELALREEQEKSERLLLNILPAPIADKLKKNQGIIAENFDEVSILFADIVGFTPISSQLHPIELVNLLNEIFSTFDQLAEQYQLEKIKTIGDAYMVAAGLPLPRKDHAEAIANMALEMQAAIHQFRHHDREPFRLRIGINSGPVVAGVIGIRKFIYDLWGDAVNVASRMESQGEMGRIQVTAAAYDRLKNRFIFEERGAIEIKGKGKMHTYWLVGKKTLNLAKTPTRNSDPTP